MGDLAGCASTLVLTLVAVGIGVESPGRLLPPVMVAAGVFYALWKTRGEEHGAE